MPEKNMAKWGILAKCVAKGSLEQLLRVSGIGYQLESQ